MPPFIALSTDAETTAIARTIGDVLWDDLNFEREFAFIPRDIYATVPSPKSFDDVPFDRWRELNADGVVVGTVQKVGNGFQIQVRLFDVRTKRQVFGKEYSGSSNARLYAHTISDDIHLQQRALRGVARTKLAFDSDRDGERMTGTVETRGVKEIYTADYDGENQRRVTTNRTLNINPAWSPDARSLAYTSYRRGPPSIFVSHIYDGIFEEVTKGVGESWLPAWSPDGTRVAFTSTRDGNSEIYVTNRDGSNVRRLTNNPAIDSTPTWAPIGHADRVHVRPVGLAADLSHRGGRARGRAAAHVGVLRGPADVVARAVQRNRLRVAQRPGLRHQDHRRGDAHGETAHVRRGQQREPVVRAQRQAHRVHVDAGRQGADLHDYTGRQEPETGDTDRQQLPARLVQIGWSTRCRLQSQRC